MKNKINYLAIITFYLLAVSIRYLTNKTGFLDDLIANDILKGILTGVGPAIGALIVFKLFNIKAVLSLKGNYKNIFIPFLLYWAVPVILITGVSFFTKGTLPIFSVFAILIYGLLEEIGWRGFLQQEFKSLPLFVNILIVASMWFIWHLNFNFTSSNLLFLGILLLGTWGIGKVADSTQSLLAVSAFHSLNNFFPNINTATLSILITLLSVWVISLVIRKRQSKKSFS